MALQCWKSTLLERTPAMLSKRVLPVALAMVLVGCASHATPPAPAGPPKPHLISVTLIISGMT
jgi:hypothetical protein